MIVSHIELLNNYLPLFPQLKEVDHFIKSNNLSTLQLTEKLVLSEQVSVIPITGKQNPQASEKLEVHQKWIDVHFTIEGTDLVVYKSSHICTVLDMPYNSQDDYALYKDKFEGEISIPANYFCLITPETAHMAMCGNGDIKKLVFKLKYE